MSKFLKNLKHSWKRNFPDKKLEIPKHKSPITTPTTKDEGVDAAKGKFYANINRFPEAFVSGVKPTVIISNELQAQITYLHNEFGNIEWSGFLLYEVLEGSLAAPENMVIKAVGIFPCDVGSSAYTEYDPGDFILDMDDAYDFLNKGYKLGHIHTHHSMSCFFSGTDMGELHSNAPNYADSYYLSLIVNKSNSYCAKIAKIVTLEEVKTMAHVDCTIKYEIKDKVLEQIAKIRPKYKTPTYASYTPTFYSSKTTSKKTTAQDWEDYYDSMADDYWDDQKSLDKSKGKSTTEKHWDSSKMCYTDRYGNEIDESEPMIGLSSRDGDYDEENWYKPLNQTKREESFQDLDQAIADLDKFLNGEDVKEDLLITKELLMGATPDETKERIFLYSFGQAINIKPAKTWYMWTTIEILTYIANYCSSRQYATFVERWEKVYEAIDEDSLKHGVKKIDTLFFIEEEISKYKRTHLAYCVGVILTKVKEVRERLIEQVFETENRFSYDVGLEQKYSIVGDFFHSWIEFSLNSSYDN